jgi:hypothetical protein
MRDVVPGNLHAPDRTKRTQTCSERIDPRAATSVGNTIHMQMSIVLYGFNKLKTAVYVGEDPPDDPGTRRSGKLPNDNWESV